MADSRRFGFGRTSRSVLLLHSLLRQFMLQCSELLSGAELLRPAVLPSSLLLFFVLHDELLRADELPTGVLRPSGR
jgi:hypothetical protein